MGLSDVLRQLLSRATLGSASLESASSELTSPESASAGAGLTGPPQSSNGASSSHLFWQLPALRGGDTIVEAQADIEILDIPQNPKLFFWALQASFARSGRVLGAGHLGLQFYPLHPGNGALNWGGYHGADTSEHGELPGSELRLPSTPGNTNTCDYPWLPKRRYRYRIFRSPDRGWRGSVTDMETGVETVIRDLWCEGDELTNLMVWTEAFADCDDPATSVRWSNLRALTSGGLRLSPHAVLVNYQTVSAGGCLTSDCEPGQTQDGAWTVNQRTGVERQTIQGSVLSF